MLSPQGFWPEEDTCAGGQPGSLVPGGDQPEEVYPFLSRVIAGDFRSRNAGCSA